MRLYKHPFKLIATVIKSTENLIKLIYDYMFNAASRLNLYISILTFSTELVMI